VNQVQVEGKTYQMRPKVGLTVAQSISVAHIEQSLRFDERVFASRFLSRGDSKGGPGSVA
jgi:hypothetical protein